MAILRRRAEKGGTGQRGAHPSESALIKEKWQRGCIRTAPSTAFSTSAAITLSIFNKTRAESKGGKGIISQNWKCKLAGPIEGLTFCRSKHFIRFPRRTASIMEVEWRSCTEEGGRGRAHHKFIKEKGVHVK